MAVSRVLRNRWVWACCSAASSGQGRYAALQRQAHLVTKGLRMAAQRQALRLGRHRQAHGTVAGLPAPHRAGTRPTTLVTRNARSQHSGQGIRPHRPSGAHAASPSQHRSRCPQPDGRHGAGPGLRRYPQRHRLSDQRRQGGVQPGGTVAGIVGITKRLTQPLQLLGTQRVHPFVGSELALAGHQLGDDPAEGHHSEQQEHVVLIERQRERRLWGGQRRS